MASTSFPVGRRVLVVDADHKSLKLLKTRLRNCDYQVTTTNLAQEALDLLQQGFDIVICDVNITDMDAYQFVPQVLKLDLPVILMSVDGEDSSSAVLKGVQHGACDYLIKPIRQKELQYIWQHVVRKRMGVVEGQENENLAGEIRKNGDGQQLGVICGKKRKSIDGTVKKKKQGQRVVWRRELHERFLRAVEILGDKCGPKGILELMAVAGLTRENVASHLQKYRISKSRELKAGASVVNFSDMSPIDHQRFYNTVMNANNTTPPIFEEGDVVGSSIEGQSESKLHTSTNGLPRLRSNNNQSCVIATENTTNLTNSHSLNTNPATMKNLQLNGCFDLQLNILPAADFNFGPTHQELVIDDHMYSWPNFSIDTVMTTIKDNVLSDHSPYYPR